MIKPLLKRINVDFSCHYPLARHTWYKVGGEAEIAVFPENLDQLIAIYLFAVHRKTPCFLIGGGANIIISDSGLPGITIMTERLNRVRLMSGKIFAECGTSLEDLAEFACNHKISGFEFLYNIPGSVGGSLMMNAGNNYGEMKYITPFVLALKRSGKIQGFRKHNCHFGYRTSLFKQRNFLILQAAFSASDRKPYHKIRTLMDSIKNERETKFPLEFPNGGSVFKRPEGDYAGRLIEVSGCGGLSEGGAEVSTKHKGFIINRDNATADDIKCLIRNVQKRVFDNSGIKLEREQIFLPEDYINI